MLVATVSVEDPEVATEAGLNEAVVPGGNPITLNSTLPANAPTALIVATYVVLPPGAIDREPGDTVREKSGIVIVRVGGCGSVTPALSVTTSEAEYVPAEE